MLDDDDDPDFTGGPTSAPFIIYVALFILGFFGALLWATIYTVRAIVQ
jgi:hypothetical protein